jgi:hypothetical protein
LIFGLGVSRTVFGTAFFINPEQFLPALVIYLPINSKWKLLLLLIMSEIEAFSIWHYSLEKHINYLYG